MALVYYAGHGLEMAGKNVLAPKDMEIDCEKKTPKRALDLDQLFSAVAGAPQQIVLLDACRNDPFPQCPKRSIGGGSGFRGFTRVGAEDRSLLIANSTLGGQLAADGSPGEHSPFARALLTRFSTDASSYLRDLLEQAAGDVQKASHGSQVPEVLTRGGAVRICLDEAACGRVATDGVATSGAAAAPAPAPAGDPAVAWAAVKESTSESVLQAFLREYPDGVYAELAKARLAAIRSRQQAALPPQAPAAGDAGGSEASPPRAPLPPPLIVQYRGQFGDNHVVGRFERLDANRWLETNRESNPGRDNVLSFEDKGRKGGVIEMFDDTRAMWIRIDLNTRRIFWSTNGKKSWNYIYNITSAK